MKTRKTDIFKLVWLQGGHPTAESSSTVCIPALSQVIKFSQIAPGCASHRGVKLCGVLPTVESSSPVCITPCSQTAHRRVKIEIFVNPWLLRTITRNPFRGNTSIRKEKIWRKKNFTPLCHAHRGVEFFRTLWSNSSAKSQLNSKILPLSLHVYYFCFNCTKIRKKLFKVLILK